MEFNEHGFLEELLALRRESWDTNIPTQMNELFSSDFNLNNFEENPDVIFANSFCEGFSAPIDHHQYSNFNNEVYEFSAPQFTESSYNTAPFPVQEEYSLSMLEDEGLFGDDIQNMQEELCKLEPVQSPEVPENFKFSSFSERKVRGKKLEGQPSKNLMAERRRRKRLNDRLSMLRSIVPKISKMDRTAILADTIDYTKELLDRITKLQQEIESGGSDQGKMVDMFKDIHSNENVVRNSPKFKVERRNRDTQIEICCAGKPGLLLSSVTTLEALGLEIEQCVISCFNDFAMQASCAEDLDQKSDLSPDDIKQALFRNAGYGGRCL
ncbi:Beta HLH protein 93 [Tripterygium wilfordii]|uniref:Beta HLH protein 93 n=1 Tax=Tripterygium wilfordii TaxID=458696 RepID=A0A7J7D0D6_TRIWF|nr:transcription factor bHLH93-like [Tripterygium wilfordii]KAF5739807.1 Beta HLH protein 93 [Tripterygium wilfordii]